VVLVHLGQGNGVSAPSAPELYSAIKKLVDLGQPVFPCKVTGQKAKAPLTRNGLHDATLDLELIKRWWRAKGDSAIGIPTGILWDVLDVDIKESADGRRHLPFLTRLGLLNGCQKVVQSPSGGWHLYFTATHGLTNKAAGASLGLDVRAKGGYVLAPPSYLTEAVNAEGRVYSGPYLEHEPPTGSTSDPLWWNLIVSALAPKDPVTNKEIPLLPSERRASLASLREWVSIRQAGERNNALHWAVCRCIDNGLDPHELVEPALLTGLAEDEILLTISSAMKRAGVGVEELQSEAEAMFPDEV
jgi:hypothetical protein